MAAERSIGSGLRRVATVSARRGGLEAALATAARAGLVADDRRTDLALSPPGATALGPWRLAVRSALFLQQKFDLKSFFLNNSKGEYSSGSTRQGVQGVQGAPQLQRSG